MGESAPVIGGEPLSVQLKSLGASLQAMMVSDSLKLPPRNLLSTLDKEKENCEVSSETVDTFLSAESPVSFKLGAKFPFFGLNFIVFFSDLEKFCWEKL